MRAFSSEFSKIPERPYKHFYSYVGQGLCVVRERTCFCLRRLSARVSDGLTIVAAFVSLKEFILFPDSFCEMHNDCSGGAAAAGVN